MSTNDINGHEITPGDTVVCRARYYQRVRFGDTTMVAATDGRCIESDELSKTYGFDARFKGENFEIVGFGPNSPYRYPDPSRPLHNHNGELTKGTNPMIHTAIRIDGINTTDELVNMLNNRTNSCCLPHYETSFILLKSWVEQDIKIFPGHQWLMLSPVSIAEIAGPPVRFRNVK